MRLGPFYECRPLSEPNKICTCICNDIHFCVLWHSLLRLIQSWTFVQISFILQEIIFALDPRPPCRGWHRWGHTLENCMCVNSALNSRLGLPLTIVRYQVCDIICKCLWSKNWKKMISPYITNCKTFGLRLFITFFINAFEEMGKLYLNTK